MNQLETSRTPVKPRRRPLRAAWQVLCWVGSSALKVVCLLVCLMMISVLFLAGYQFLLHSPHIRLERVVITGVEDRVKRELLDMSGLRSDMTLLAVNMRELKENLESHPWVRSVEVKKQYPHTLVVRAIREEPRALVSMGGLYYMNRQGRMFKQVDMEEEVDYPVITGEFEDEEQRDQGLRLAAYVLGVLEDQGAVWMKEEISEVHLGTAGNASLYFRSLPAVVQVSARDLEKKVDDLNRIVKHLRDTNQVGKATAINLHYHDGVVVSFKRG